MIRPTSPLALTSPPVRGAISPHAAPPGASFAAPADRVVLSGAGAPAEAPAEPARISRKGWVLLGLAAVAAVAGGVTAVAAQQAVAAPAPAVSAVAPRIEARAPIAAWNGDLDARPELASSGLRQVPAPIPFTGEALKIQESHGSETNGVGARLDWRVSTLEDGHSHHSWMLSNLDSVRADFMKEGSSDWNAHFTMAPAGNAGRLVSVIVREGGYHGGMHDAEQVTLRTFDRETGSPVTLDELLAPHDFEDLVGAVRAGLAGEEALEFQHGEAALQEWVNTSFSVREEGGRAVITVAVPHAIESARGSVARFTFHLAPGVDITSAR